nr:hypothetical protein [Tanacetum cinerariifolium]
MAYLTFADTHNMPAFLSKSDASAGFDQIVDFLNRHVIQYALMVNPTIYVSCIKQFWATVLIKKKIQKVFANMHRVGKGFSGVETPLFVTMLVQPQPSAAKEEDEVQLKQDKIAQALEIFKLKRRVKKLEKQRRSKSLGLKGLRKVGTSQRIESSAEIVMETQADLGAELQGSKDGDNAAIKEASAIESSVFNDEEVTMTMAQTLIKMKAEKARLLNEQMSKRLHDDEVEQAAAKEQQEKDDMEKSKVLQKHYVDKTGNIDWNVVVEQMQQKHLDNIRKYQSLKRKLISIAQARKNMIVYLKNMAGYKMEHFKGMTYDKVRPIFEREYNKVQTLFNPNKDLEEPQKKRVAEETWREMSEEDVKNMLEIVPVSEFKVEALQVKEDLDALWRLVKEKFSTAVPTVDKEKALWVELKREELSLVKWSHDPDAECKATS